MYEDLSQIEFVQDILNWPGRNMKSLRGPADKPEFQFNSNVTKNRTI